MLACGSAVRWLRDSQLLGHHSHRSSPSPFARDYLTIWPASSSRLSPTCAGRSFEYSPHRRHLIDIRTVGVFLSSLSILSTGLGGYFYFYQLPQRRRAVVGERHLHIMQSPSVWRLIDDQRSTTTLKGRAHSRLSSQSSCFAEAKYMWRL